VAVVTISRQLGSKGDLVDKDLITEVAREANVPESEVERYDEQSESPAKRFIRGLIAPSRTVPVPPAMLWGLEFPYEVSASLLSGEAPVTEESHFLDQQDYLRFLQAAVNRLYERGNAIIVGRGGQAILRGYPNTLHVRTVAPLKARAQVVSDRWRVTPRAGRDMAQKSDRRRAAYLRDNYDIDWNDVALYHFIVNTAYTPREAAARTIVSAVRRTSAH
jgi:hypothetical protein